MLSNLNYILLQRSLFDPQTNTFEMLHLQARIKQVRLKEQEEQTRMMARLQEMRKGELKSAMSEGSRVMIKGRRVMGVEESGREWARRRRQHKERNKDGEAEEEISGSMAESRNDDKENRNVDIADHRGPVKGWAEHFHRYLKAKTDVPEDTDLFKPKINKESERIARRNGIGEMPVEQRLLKYGQLMKVNRERELKEKLEQTKKPKQQKISLDNCQNQIFDKLYNQGLRLTKKKLQMQQQTCTFQPCLSPSYPKPLQNRKPLYHLKSPPKDPQPSVSPARKHNPKDFSNFLKRNEVLLEKRKLCQEKKQVQEPESPNCTFRPVINQRSSEMITALRREARRDEQKWLERTEGNEEGTQVEQKEKKIKRKVKPLKLLNVSVGDILQTEDSLPIKTMESCMLSNRVRIQQTFMMTGQQIILTNRVRTQQQIITTRPELNPRNMFTDDFDILQRQLQDMLKQVQ